VTTNVGVDVGVEPGLTRAPWTPASIAGLVYDRNANDAVGSPVTSWPGLLETATIVGAPTQVATGLGGNAVRFNGTNQAITIDGVAPVGSGIDKAYTKVLLFRCPALVSGTFLWGWGSLASGTPYMGGGIFGVNLQCRKRDDALATADVLPSPPTINVWYARIDICHGTTIESYINNVSLGAPVAYDVGQTTLTGYALAARTNNGAPGNWSEVDIAHSALYSVAISAADAAQWWTYLQAQHGV